MEILIAVLACVGILIVAGLLLEFVFHNSVAECKKTLLALAVFLGAGCAYILHFDPAFGQSLQVLVGGVFAVIGCFAAPQFSEQDFSKALTSLTGGIFSILQFFSINNPSTEAEVYTLLGLFVAAFAIWWTNNAGHRTPKEA